MPTLLLSRRHSDDSNAMWRAALYTGWDVQRLQSYSVPAGLREREPVLYTETLLADAVAEPLGLVLLEPTYDWLPRLPIPYRKREVTLGTLGLARQLTSRAFVKPVDEKIFPARVYASGSEIEPTLELAADTPVLISEPVTWTLEVRAFVRDRTVADLSAYIRDGNIARSEAGEWPLSEQERAGATAFLGTLLSDPQVALPAAVVIDVGLIQGQGWAVVEANACWAAGICGCDPRALLPVMRRASVPEPALSAEDRPWSRALHRAAAPG